MTNSENTQKRKSSNSFWMIFFAGIGAFAAAGMVMFFLTIMSAVMGGGDSMSFNLDSDDDEDLLKVGVVEVNEEIVGSKKIIEQLYEFRDDEDIEAIVLRIESPGGSSAHSQEMFNAIMTVKQKKKVVASMGAMAASGGYYIAAACDSIYALPSTLTASIGVIAVTTEIKDLMAWMKMKPHVYTSGKHKDMLSPLKTPSEDDEALIRAMIMDIYEQFIADIIKGRPGIDEAKLRSVADGRVMSGAQAKEMGLIDEFGGLKEAAFKAIELAGKKTEKDPKLVYPKEDTEEWLVKILSNSTSAAVHAFFGAAAPQSTGVQTRMPTNR